MALVTTHRKYSAYEWQPLSPHPVRLPLQNLNSKCTLPNADPTHW